MRLTSPQIKSIIITLIIVTLSLSAFSIYQLDQFNKQTNLLIQKTLELNTATAKLQSLSPILDLADKVKPPIQEDYSGTQIFSSYVMTWKYEKWTESTDYDDGNSPVLIYIPEDGALVHFLLIQSAYPVKSYDLRLTVQRGIAYSNDSWVRQGTVDEVFYWPPNPYLGNPDVYGAPIVWSLTTDENGGFETPALGKGWYTINLFGPIRYLGNGYAIGSRSSIGPNTTLEKYRVYLTVDVMKDGVLILFAATSDFPPF